MAWPTAAVTATSGVSPAPADGKALRSSRTVSKMGTSPKRGTRQSEKRGFRIFPLAKLRMAPPSEAVTSRTTFTRPLPRSAAISAQVAT